MAPRPALAVANEQLRLRRLEQDRAAICKALGIVDDESADLPLLVANMMAKQRRLDDLLRAIARRIDRSAASYELADVVRVIGQEVGA